MPFGSQDTHYLEDFLDANEAMDMFGDRQDLDLRPPPTDGAPGADQPSEPTEPRATVEMTARQFMNMIA